MPLCSNIFALKNGFVCALSAGGVCSVSSASGMTGDDSRLLLPHPLSHGLSHRHVSLWHLGIWWYTYTCSHMSGGIKTYVTIYCLSWATVFLGLLLFIALPVHSLLHFTLWIISLLSLRFTVVHDNKSTSGCSTVSPLQQLSFSLACFIPSFLITMTNWICSIGNCLPLLIQWAIVNEKQRTRKERGPFGFSACVWQSV